MDAVLVCLTAFLAAGVTLFSGFGLGTLLMPVFALFFPIQSAIALTAIVHFFNNLLKLMLLGRYADRHVVLQFGVPAILASFLGAWVLGRLSDLPPLMHYRLFAHEFQVIPVKVAVATLLIVFTQLELTLNEGTLSFDKQYLPLGGIISGFFGGLSGHQGALRSAFLIKCGLSKEGFLGSGVVIACLVDIARLAVYGAAFSSITGDGDLVLLLAAIGSAFGGTWMGNQLAHKVTIRTIQIIVSIMVFGIAVGLGAGLI
jgi:uncharacterized membrane protein YfcA